MRAQPFLGAVGVPPTLAPQCLSLEPASLLGLRLGHAWDIWNKPRLWVSRNFFKLIRALNDSPLGESHHLAITGETGKSMHICLWCASII